MGAILKTRFKIWGPPQKFGADKHAFFGAISDEFATSHFDREYLQNGTRYQQSEKGVANYDLLM